MITKKLKGKSAEDVSGAEREKIKRLGIIAMFSDDDLFDKLVLKGGNAIDIVHRISTRASIDLDFSIADDLDIEKAFPKIVNVLTKTFIEGGYHAFDIKIVARPKAELPKSLSDFWGGYLVEFKLISPERFKEVGGEINTIRREAINLGEGSKFTIDISRYEYVENKQSAKIDGFMIYVYSPIMIVCEKLRAICQQLPEYNHVIQRGSGGKPRARDFVDIEALVKVFELDITTNEAKEILTAMFRLKHVPLSFLEYVQRTRDFHEIDFPSVIATMRPGVVLEEFGYYHRFVTDLCEKLKPLWDE